MSGQAQVGGGVVTVDQLIGYVVVSSHRLAEAKERELLLQHQRPREKSEAITRLMQTADPQKDGKPYSATAAGELVGNDLTFALAEEDRRGATGHTIRCMGEYEAAKLRARYAIAKAELAVIDDEPVAMALDKSHAAVAV